MINRILASLAIGHTIMAIIVQGLTHDPILSGSAALVAIAFGSIHWPED